MLLEAGEFKYLSGLFEHLEDGPIVSWKLMILPFPSWTHMYRRHISRFPDSSWHSTTRVHRIHFKLFAPYLKTSTKNLEPWLAGSRYSMDQAALSIHKTPAWDQHSEEESIPSSENVHLLGQEARVLIIAGTAIHSSLKNAEQNINILLEYGRCRDHLII